MSYCVNCGVELDPSLKECPLCHTPVMRPTSEMDGDAAASFPDTRGKVDERLRNKDLWIFIAIVLGATTVSCIVLNFIIKPQTPWSVVPAGICFIIAVFLLPIFLRSKLPLFVLSLFDTLAVGLYLFMLSFLTTDYHWFLYLGLPITILTGIMVTIFVILLGTKRLTFLKGALVLFIEVPVFCLLLETIIDYASGNGIHLLWSAIVAMVCAVIVVIIITVLRMKRLRNEVRRRLHF